MKPALRLSIFGIFLAMLMLESAGCAGRPPAKTESTSTKSTPSRSSTITSWLNEGHSSIGVVTLGPDQFLYQDWFEFEPAFKEHFAQTATYTTVRPKELKRREVALDEAFHETAESYFRSLPQSGEAAGVGLILAPAVIVVGTLAKSAIGEFEWVQPRPIVQPLDSVQSPVNSIPMKLLSKQRLASAIGDHIIQRSQNRTVPRFLEVSFEQARERSLWTASADGLLTVRVQSVDFIVYEGDNPEAILFVHVWANFNRLVSRPIEYTSRTLDLSAWTANGSLLLREEVDRAVESIAANILADFFAGT